MFSSYFRTCVCEFGTKQCWNQASGTKSEPQSSGRSIGGFSIDQPIDWEVRTANSRPLDWSADRSSRILAWTKSLGIDRSIDRGNRSREQRALESINGSIGQSGSISRSIQNINPSTVAIGIDPQIDSTACNRLSSVWIDWKAGFRPRDLVVQLLDHRGCRLCHVYLRLHPLAHVEQGSGIS